MNNSSNPEQKKEAHKIDYKIPLFRAFKKKTTLTNPVDKPVFEKIFESPLGEYLIKRFLHKINSIDKAIFYNDMVLFRKLKDTKTVLRVSRLMYNRYVSSKNSFCTSGKSVFRLISNDDLWKDCITKQNEDFKQLEDKDLLAGNVLGVYGKAVSRIKKEIASQRASQELFDEVYHVVERDLKYDLFPRFLNSPFYVYYLKFMDMCADSLVAYADFQPLRVLGRGAFGVVRSIFKKDTGFIYAAKCISKKRVIATKSYSAIQNERDLMVELGSLNSRFIVGLNYAIHDKNTLYLVLDLMLGSDLKHHLNKEEFFDEERSKFYAAEILLGLEHMHSKNIINRDLKLENVLLDEHGHCKLSDFGLSVQTTKPIKGYAGTPGYTAPEVVTNSYYNKAVDFFSLGVLIYRLLSGKKPFESKNGGHGDLDKNVVNLTPKFPAEVFSADAADLLSRLLEKDPLKRIGVSEGTEEIKNHPWFKSVDFGLLESGYLDAPIKPNLEDFNGTNVTVNYRGNDDKFRNIKISEEFDKSLNKNFYYTKKESKQKEIINAIKKIDDETLENNFQVPDEKKTGWLTIKNFTHIPKFSDKNYETLKVPKKKAAPKQKLSDILGEEMNVLNLKRHSGLMDEQKLKYIHKLRKSVNNEEISKTKEDKPKKKPWFKRIFGKSKNKEKKK